MGADLGTGTGMGMELRGEMFRILMLRRCVRFWGKISKKKNVTFYKKYYSFSLTISVLP